jgi:hypothetical protein
VTRKIVAVAAGGGGVHLATSAAADPAPEPGIATSPIHLLSPATVTTEGGTELALPAGVYILEQPAWFALDAEFKRLQDAETRLDAENASLRASAAGPGFGLRATLLLVTTAIAAGIAIGAAAY